jgi:AraC family transcriptional regulator, arabinose operon regulatory protein
MDDPMMKSSRFVHDGFSGQHMVVLPRPVVQAAARHPLLRSLLATDAGFFPEAAAHGVEREKGVAGTILIVCRAGRGWLRIGRGKDAAEHAVGPGDVVLIPPSAPHAYGADEVQPWTIQWVHFCGEETVCWLRWHRWTEGGVRHLAPGGAGQIDLGRVHEQLAQGYDERHLLLAATALRWALAQLGGLGDARVGVTTHEAINVVERWMREHSSERVSLGELARRAGLSPAHFTMLFRRRFGFAPIDFFLRLKIGRACNLLDNTEWPVRRVAEEVGFEDALYFSRRFRRVMGLSPKAYRAAQKG